MFTSKPGSCLISSANSFAFPPRTAANIDHRRKRTLWEREKKRKKEKEMREMKTERNKRRQQL